MTKMLIAMGETINERTVIVIESINISPCQQNIENIQPPTLLISGETVGDKSILLVEKA